MNIINPAGKGSAQSNLLYRGLCLLSALAAIFLLSSPAFGADYTWTGGSNNTWATTGNWTSVSNPNTAPNSSAAAVVFGTATNVSPNLAASAQVGSITFNPGGSAFTISRSNSFTLTLATGGSIINNSSNLQTFSTAVALGGTSTWNAANGGLTVSGVISGAGGSLTETGTGTLTLSGTNTYGGGTTISAGTLLVGGTAGTLGSGAVSDSSLLNINRSNAISISNIIRGTGILEQTGAGTTTLTGANTYSGGTTISAGILQVGTGGTLGTAGVIDNSALAYSGTGTVTEGNVISGTGTVSQTGTGTTSLTATNSYSGGTTISGGVLQFASTGNLGTNTVLVNGGTLRWASGNTADISSILSLGSSGGIFDTNGNNVTLASTMAGSGPLTKTGTGILTLDAATPATATTVTGGTLLLGAANVLPSITTLTVNGTTANTTNTFDLNGNNLTVTGLTFGGTTAKANAANVVSTEAGTLTLGGNVTYTNASSGSNNPGTASLTGNLNLGSATRTFTIADSTKTNTELNVSAVISGTGGISKVGAGVLVLSGSNNYSGGTTITAGALRISSAANIADTNVQLNGGVLELAGNVALTPGTGAGQVQWTGSGGFSAFGGDRTVNYDGGADLTWGTNFVKTGSSLILGSTSSDSMVTLANNINLNGAVQAVTVTAGSAPTSAQLSGVLSNGGLAVSGTGVLSLSGLNTYTGITTIANGTTLEVTNLANGGSSSGLGASSNAAANLQIVGGTLTYSGTGNSSTDRLIEIGSGSSDFPVIAASGVAGVSDSGAVVFSNTGAIGFTSANQSVTLDFSGSNTAANTFDPVIGNNGDTGNKAVNVYKEGAGTWVLAGANTYAGTTYIASGTLSVTNNSGLGTGLGTNTGVTVADGAILNLNNVNIGAQTILLYGPETGTGTGGITATGTSTASGRINLEGDATVGGSGSLFLTGYDVDEGGGSILTKVGTGTVTFGGTTFNDDNYVVVSAGTLVLDKVLGGDPNAFAWAVSAPIPAAQPGLIIQNGATVQLSGNTGDEIGYMVTVEVDSGGLFDLNGRSESIEGLTGSGTVTSTVAGNSLLTVGGTESYYYLGFSSAFSGVIQDGAGVVSVTKGDTGTFTLSGADTYSGATIVSSGTLIVANNAGLGSTVGSTTVNNGATLNLDNVAIGGEAISITGTGVGGIGVLTNTGTSSLAGNLTLNGNSTIGGAGSLTLTGAVTGNHTLTDIDTGTVTLGGTTNNSNLSVTVNAGTVILAKNGSDSVHAVGNGLTINNGGTVQLAGNNGDQIYTQANVVVNSGGTLDFNGRDEGIASISGTGTLTNTAAGTTSTFTLGDLDENTQFDGTVQDGAGKLAIQKIGNGTVTFTAANTYSGGTTVNGGLFSVANNSAAGTGVVTVNSGTFYVQDDIIIANTVVLAGGTYQHDVDGGASLAHTIDSTSSFGSAAPTTTASILDGTSTDPVTLVSDFAATSGADNDTVRRSAVYDLSGVDIIDGATNTTDTFVLQLTISSVELQSYLAYLDPNDNLWENAVGGNIGGTPTFVLGAYDPTTDFQLGFYGVDTATGSVWAVLDHNTSFAIATTAPEPQTWLLLICGMLALLGFRRRAQSVSGRQDP